jgi:hypothetical protein
MDVTWKLQNAVKLSQFFAKNFIGNDAEKEKQA